ncbi:MAG: hypothetical protein ACRDPC_02350 [Solirubrobacteraceae bacterium]
MAALVLAACGGAGERSGVRERAAAAPVAELEDQLGFSSAGIMAQQNRVEARIQACMRQSGFDYVPIDPFAGQTTVAKATRLSDEDFVKQFGYGISTLWGRGSPREADPNERIRAGLGAADRSAYDRALWGDHPGSTFTDAVDSGDLTRLGGCTRKAAVAAFGDGQVIARIVARFDALDERISSDQRMVRADERWAACMASAGYRFESGDEIEEHFTKGMEDIVGPLPGPLATGPPAGEKPRPYDRAALAALQQEEIAAARTEYACEREHIAPVEAVVRPEYEARFREENQNLIRVVKEVWK